MHPTPRHRSLASPLGRSAWLGLPIRRIVDQGTAAEVFDDPRHPYTKALLSAVPVVDLGQRREIIRLDGDMSSPADPPSGCHFHPRCPESTPDCARAYPAATRPSDTREVRYMHV